MGIYIVAKFGPDWSIFADARVLTKSNMANFLIQADNWDSSGPINSIIDLIPDLMVTYILTKFGADWLIFVDARVLTRKLWTDRGTDGWTEEWTDVGQTDGQRWLVSDYNSSLSTPCSGELKTQKYWAKGSGHITSNNLDKAIPLKFVV